MHEQEELLFLIFVEPSINFCIDLWSFTFWIIEPKPPHSGKDFRIGIEAPIQMGQFFPQRPIGHKSTELEGGETR